MATQQQISNTSTSHLSSFLINKLDRFMPRKALVPSDRLGYLYDACCDDVIVYSVKKYKSELAQSQQPTACSIKKYNVDRSSHLLDMINMQPELQLSIALGMSRAFGVDALIKYSRPLNKYTRVMTYTYNSRTEYLSKDEFTFLNKNELPKPYMRATHIIALIHCGIDVVAVLQLPHDDELIDDIDGAIEKVCNRLKADDTNLESSKDDAYFLEKIVHTEVFSNISLLSKVNSLADFYDRICRYNNYRSVNIYTPYNYYLCPIQEFYTINNTQLVTSDEIQPMYGSNLKHYLLQLSLDFQTLMGTMDQDYPNIQRCLKNQFYEIRTRWLNLKEMYENEKRRLRVLVIRIRRGEKDQWMAHQAIHDEEAANLRKTKNKFTNDMNTMREKEHLIKDLLEKHIEYRTALDYGLKNNDDEKSIEDKLLSNRKNERIICANDNLYKNQKSQWYTLCGQLLNECAENSQIKLFYVDFSDCSYKLSHFMIFPTIKKNSDEHAIKSATTLSSQRSTSNEIINILLLGESGVGKSTFINAFVNYLKFDILERAQKNPVVLIPVSFIITTGNDFTERQVTFGEQGIMSNEDPNQTGQSVTQHCKSYVFTLQDNHADGRKLRIIDTPGIGDVRGLAQDDNNMQHILSYINNLTHLNAICILMKPNNARLNVFFRSCFMQLFDMLGEHARDKIIFCFTNARATFYTPGNTAPLLKTLLQSLPVQGIPFAKDNTFCFDSESFRYLVAVQNNIEFNDEQQQDYMNSWNKSSAEARRFLNYIRTKMTTSHVLSELESVKHAQLRMNLMIRPILETMRNILRNIVLWNAGLRTTSIEIRPKFLKGSIAICLTCLRQPYQVGNFWMIPDKFHVFHNKCRTCECDPSHHYPINFELQYKQRDRSSTSSRTEMTNMLDDLCETSATFAHFFFRTDGTLQNDLFLSGIERMIQEENDICANKKPCPHNCTLLNQLQQLKIIYENMKKKMAVAKEHLQLSEICHKIEDMNRYPVIASQMDATKESLKFMIKYHEYEVPR